MDRLFDAYRAMHEQAFAPIFCKDGFNSKRQVEACVAAGCKGIEYTLRKPDAREMIPWIRKNYPDLYLLVGSTVDSDAVVARQRCKHPQLMTVAEVADIGVDGFVSMLGWSDESLRKYSATHIIAPTAMTVREALLQTDCGAHFQKLLGSDLDFVRRCRGGAAFDYCPILVTGGQTPETMGATFQAGAVMVGTGFDLTMKGLDADASVEQITEIVKTYVAAAKQARAAAWPELAAADGGPKQAWLDALPHYHPF